MSKAENHLAKAAEDWRGGNALEVGKTIFENLPSDARPSWAAGVFRLVLTKSGIKSNAPPGWTRRLVQRFVGRSGDRPSLFQLVLDTADNKALWRNGHRVSSQVRDSVLELLELRRTGGLTSSQEQMICLLGLAELVAKVTYNATNPRDEFDEDSGWWIAVCLRAFVDQYGHDNELADSAWSALCAFSR